MDNMEQKDRGLFDNTIKGVIREGVAELKGFALDLLIELSKGVTQSLERYREQLQE